MKRDDALHGTMRSRIKDAAFGVLNGRESEALFSNDIIEPANCHNSIGFFSLSRELVFFREWAYAIQLGLGSWSTSRAKVEL